MQLFLVIISDKLQNNLIIFNFVWTLNTHRETKIASKNKKVQHDTDTLTPVFSPCLNVLFTTHSQIKNTPCITLYGALDVVTHPKCNQDKPVV